MVVTGNVIKADAGKALRRKGSTEPSAVTRVALAPNDSPDNWEDCDLPVPGDEAIEADKDAALRRFGVEV